LLKYDTVRSHKVREEGSKGGREGRREGGREGEDNVPECDAINFDVTVMLDHEGRGHL